MKIDSGFLSSFSPKAREDSPEVKPKLDNASDQVNQVEKDTQAKTYTEDELIKAIESANDSIQTYDRKLQFSIHKKTKDIMVKVVDTNTNQVIREIPPEKILDLVAKLCELAGIIVDEKV